MKWTLFLALAVSCSATHAPDDAGTNVVAGADVDAGTDIDAGIDPDTLPGDDAMLTVFDQRQLSFTGTDNERVQETTVTFPHGTFEHIVLHLALECPSSGGCDVYDRLGSLGAVFPGITQADGGTTETVVELARFVTPFHVGMTWEADITDLRPLLRGDVKVRGFIDTWVGPGSAYGAGWLLTVKVELTGGTPSPEALEVIPLWSPLDAVFGDPLRPIPQSVPAQTVTLTPGATSATLRTLVTGHGQGNKTNCAEFCSKSHTLTVGTTPFARTVWRTDCATSTAPNQQGTYQYSRAGWCPGASVAEWREDVTAALATSGPTTIGYDVQAYENTCRPDAAVCAGCTLGSSCPYDGSTHTEPYFHFSSVLITYR